MHTGLHSTQQRTSTRDSATPGVRGGYVPVLAFINFACAVAVAVGGMVLLGWIISDSGLTKLWFPGDNPVRAPTAVGFLCAAGALFAFMRERGPSAFAYVGRVSLGILVFTIGSASLGERLIGPHGWLGELKIDASALRMSTNTAVALVALGLSFLSPRSGEHGTFRISTTQSNLSRVAAARVVSIRWWLSQLAAIVAVLIGYIALIGHAYNTPQFFKFASDVVISVPSAICVLLLGLASFVREPDIAFAAEVLNRRGGGGLFRSLVLIAAVVVPCIGWLRLHAQQHGEIDLELGLALFSASNVVLLSAAVWVSARRLNQSEGSLIFASSELAALNATLEDRVRERTDELRNSERRFRLLADTAPAIIWMCDPHGRPEYINRAGTLFFAMRSGEVPKDQLERLAHHDDRDSAVQVAAVSIDQRKPYEVIMRLRRADGEYRWVHQRAVSRTDMSGKFLGYIGVCVDMTEMHTAREQLKEALVNREAAFDREQSLRRDLDHRVRNNLAGLLGLVMFYESAAGVRGGDGFVAAAIRGKIQAMKDVHELIARAGGQSISMDEILQRLVQAIAPQSARERIITTGDQTVTVPAQQAGAIAMIFQELLTNSCKYGVLRDHALGTLNVRWMRGEANKSTINWEEQTISEGPTRSPDQPAGGGLGLRLIEGFARSDLRGLAEFKSTPGFWKCVIHMNDHE